MWVTFVKGQSGNPGGPPKGILRKIRDQYGEDVPKMIGVLVDLALGRTPKGYEENEIKTSDRIKAASEAVDRIIGKAPQTIDLTDERTQTQAINWSAVPVEERRALLAAHERMRQLAQVVTADSDDTEH